MSDKTPGRESPTTTHAGWGEGLPRLLVSAGDERFVHELREDETTVGSGAGCVLRLPGADALHATVTHDDRDEYVLALCGDGEMNANPDTVGVSGAGERSEILRTGARFTAGPWTLVFMRAESADHGRPYAGREGGELSDQPPQPARPDYAHPDLRGPQGLEPPLD